MTEYSGLDDADIFGRQLGSWEKYHIFSRYLRMYQKYIELALTKPLNAKPAGSACATPIYWYPYLMNIESRLKLCLIETNEPSDVAPIHETIDAIFKLGASGLITCDMDNGVIYELARLVRLAIMSINRFHNYSDCLKESCQNFAWG